MVAVEKSAVPELRFPGFEGDWEGFILSDLIERIDAGWSPLCEERQANVNDWGVLKTTSTVWAGYSDLKNKKLPATLKARPALEVTDGDILVTRAGPVGRVGVVAYVKTTRPKLMISDKLIRIKNDDRIAHAEFLSRLLGGSSAQRYLSARKSGLAQAQANISQDILKRLPVIIPSLPEQQKIAAFLGSVDDKLTALRRKHELLQDYKRGMMQKIFSCELRFKRDDGSDFPAWEEKRLGEIATIRKGKGISKSDIVENGRIPCIRYGELYTHYDEIIESVVSFTNAESANLLFSQANDVIIPASGEAAIDIATAACVTKTGVALGGDLNVIQGEFNGVFLAYYLNNGKRKDVARLAQGISVVHLYGSHLVQLRLQLPTFSEQQKIANFLSAIDTKIESVAKQIEQIETFKKGLLQKMFI